MDMGTDMIKSAEFSCCGKYRYLLTRIWDENLPVAMCIGLNPSKANKQNDDPTVRLLIACLTQLGYGGLKMVNLFAYVSSSPSKLFAVPDNMGDNKSWVLTTAYSVQEIVFCWGSFKNTEYYAKQMMTLFPDAKCFGKNKNGSPWHPLAMMYAGIKSSEAVLSKFK